MEMALFGIQSILLASLRRAHTARLLACCPEPGSDKAGFEEPDER